MKIHISIEHMHPRYPLYFLWEVDGNRAHWVRHKDDESVEAVMHALNDILEEFA